MGKNQDRTVVKLTKSPIITLPHYHINTMQSLTNRSKQVVNKEMTFMERIYLPAILGGLWITLKHFLKTLFGKSASLRYPEVKRKFAPVYRGWHRPWA